ncbi:hypothetical protein C8Q74DRAFT_1224909 [Fomes fomentarius]|nr:hypothetical protein C8Q74DRAFT_1224909 [Fomes fomentarius]
MQRLIGEPLPPVARSSSVVNMSCFPNELLSEVFSCLVWTHPQQADLIAATQVCRRWRIAALGDPSLWTHVSATSIRRARTLLERSKDLLVDVNISGPSDVESMMNLLRGHSIRLHSLFVDTNFPTTAYYLTQLSHMQAPVLEALYLGGPEINALAPHIARSSAVSSPPTDSLRARGPSPMPQLRRLYLYPFAFSWNSPIYQNLLVIDLGAPRMPPPSMHRILSILHHCPDLQSFRLQTSLLLPSPVQPTDDDNSMWMVHLPQLASFHLDGPPLPQMVELLEHLTLPPTTRYVLSTQVVPPMPTRYPALPGNCHHLPSLASFRSMAFRQLDSPADTIQLTCSHSPGSTSPPTLHSAPADSIPTLTLTLRVANVVDALTSITSFVDVQALETLTISLDQTTEVPFGDWYAVLRELCSLHTLCLVGFTNNTLRCALSALRTPFACTMTSSLSGLPAAPVNVNADASSSSQTPKSTPVRKVLCAELAEIALEDVEVPCRVSTDVLWLCDERRRLGCPVRRIWGGGDVLSDRCVSGLRTRGIEIVV